MNPAELVEAFRHSISHEAVEAITDVVEIFGSVLISCLVAVFAKRIGRHLWRRYRAKPNRSYDVLDKARSYYRRSLLQEVLVNPRQRNHPDVLIARVIGRTARSTTDPRVVNAAVKAVLRESLAGRPNSVQLSILARYVRVFAGPRILSRVPGLTANPQDEPVTGTALLARLNLDASSDQPLELLERLLDLLPSASPSSTLAPLAVL